MKQQVDQHCSEKCFNVGDRVFLLLHLKQAIYEKEMLEILHALKKWRAYRMGRHFKVKMDHDSLKYFLEQLLSLQEQKKWVKNMLGYDFDIIYRKWKQNFVADALSRKDEDMEALFCVISIIQLDWINEARDEWKKEEEVWPLIQEFQKIPVQTILPELDEEGKIVLEPGAVTETRTRQLQNRSISEYLIKWKNFPAENSTWEDKNIIQKHQELLKR